MRKGRKANAMKSRPNVMFQRKRVKKKAHNVERNCLVSLRQSSMQEKGKSGLVEVEFSGVEGKMNLPGTARGYKIR